MASPCQSHRTGGVLLNGGISDEARHPARLDFAIRALRDPVSALPQPDIQMNYDGASR